MFEVNSNKYLVRETEASRFLRRELNEPTLFTFWNVGAGVWAIGYWVWKSKNMAEVLEEVGNVFEDGPQLNRSLVETLRSQHRAPDYKRVRAKLVECQRKVLRYQLDQNEETQDQRDYLRKRESHQPYWTVS